MASLDRELRLGPLGMPLVVALVMGAITLISVAAAVDMGGGWPGLLYGGVLVVRQAWRGQLWRVVTWALFEMSPVALVLGWLALYWVGRDLVRRWGARRFLWVCLGLAAGAGVVTCLVGRVWSNVRGVVYAGPWPVLGALVLSWALLFPTTQIRLFGLVSVAGRHMVFVVLGGTLLYALSRGIADLVPHFAAELIVLLWLLALPRLRARRASPHPASNAFRFEGWLSREGRRGRKGGG
jgi:membrane associated rhomboid family serine protease